VVASTNRPELLDDALLRPGRFDYTLEVQKPTRVGCRRIFEIHTRDMPIAGSVKLDEVAAGLFGLTGAEIAFVAREGAYNCLRRTLDLGALITSDDAEPDLSILEVRQADFEDALAQVSGRGHTELRSLGLGHEAGLNETRLNPGLH
jgi:transitional endoplasmic reticulum ATPase